MNTQLCLRWTEKVARYRPAQETIDTSKHEVAPIDKATAQAFVLRHHYSGSYPAGRRMFGIFRRGYGLAGVAVFSEPVNAKTITNVLPGTSEESVELGRFVMVDEVEAMGETWFLGQAFAELRREGFLGVVSFSDPRKRTDAAGHEVFGGHIGRIYKGHNGVFLGRGTPRTLRLLPDGRVLNERSIQKIRKLERNHEGAVALMVAAGAAPLEGDPRAWLAEWLPRVTRPLKHPGNLKYVWGLQRSVKRHLPESLPYPTIEDIE